MRSAIFLCGIFVVLFSSVAEAQDHRLALVIAHQTGWSGEQTLPWVLTGDLKPMSHVLSRRLGFRVVTMSNPTASKVRRMFRRIRRMVQTRKIKTFLFYYSGHADKKFFHLGRRKRDPLSYREFLSFFMKLPVKRRFAILDACHGGSVIPLAKNKVQRIRKGRTDKELLLGQQMLQSINRSLPGSQKFKDMTDLRRWFRGAMAKGVRRPRRKVNFQRLPVLQREDGSGTHIIGTVGTAWHEPKLHASLLTHHLLQGLRGQADTVKDGRITIEELYNHVHAATRQRGQEISRFVLFQGNYNFAPNYQSKLQIGSRIVGRVRVSIDRFVWTYTKKRPNRVEVNAISGRGVVDIEHKGRCWSQEVVVPKGRAIRLSRYGRRIRCRRLGQRKGSVLLEAEAQPLPELPRRHILSIAAGYWDVGQSNLRTQNLMLGVGYRWSGLVGVNLRYATGVASQGWRLHRVALSVDGGYTLPLLSSLGLFLGGYAQVGLLTSQVSESASAQTMFWGVGAQAELEWTPLRWWGLRLGAQAGINWTPQTLGSPWSLAWGVQLSQLVRFP